MFSNDGWLLSRRKQITLGVFLLTAVTLLIPAIARAELKVLATVSTKTSIYTEKSTNSTILQTLTRGEEVTVLDWQDIGFCYVEYGQVKGYVLSQDLSKISVKENYNPSQKGKISADGVNLRTHANMDASIISVLKKGTHVEVLGRVDNWYYVSSGITTGYVSMEYVELTGSSNDYYVTLRMGMSGKDVIRLQTALSEKGYYSGEINGSYGARTRDAVKAFQQDNGINPDGVADSRTLSLLYA